MLVRGESKSYGTERRFEGILHPGENVVLIEDVVTNRRPGHRIGNCPA